MKQVDSLINKM